MAAIQQVLWEDLQAQASAFEAAARDLDCDGIPEGVRQIARRLAKDLPSEVQSMAAIMEKAR